MNLPITSVSPSGSGATQRVLCRRGVALTISLLISGSALPAVANPVLDKIQRTGILKVAIREDAPPFGYLDSNGTIEGYCLDFFALLEQKLLQNLERNTLSVKLLKSTPRNRFDLVAKQIIDLECGPNTIRSDIPENTSFSTSFFTTGIQFLIKTNNRDHFKIEQNLSEATLGVINNTTTEKFIAQRYPSATLRKFSGVAARTRGVQAVEQGRIDAMISDGILLRAEAQQQELSPLEYSLIPEPPLTKDGYGMIINSKDTQWQNFVDSVINSPAAETLSNKWFGR